MIIFLILILLASPAHAQEFYVYKPVKITDGDTIKLDVSKESPLIKKLGLSVRIKGIDTPENKAFVDEFARKYKKLPSWFAESAYTSGLWTKAAIDSINGNVEDRAAFLKAMRTVQVKAPRGPLKLDAYDNPIQNVYITRLQKVKHPILGDVLMNIPVKTYTNVSQFWTDKPEDFLKRGPYKP